MLKMQGNYRVQSLYQAEKACYLTLKDKDDGGIVKVAVGLPLPAGVVDDALLAFDGKLSSRMYGNQVSLTFVGSIKSAESK